MDNHLIILTDNGMFPQTEVAWISIDIEYIRSFFVERKFIVDIYTYNDIVNCNVSIEKSYIIYASSQVPERKCFIDDVLNFLPKSNILIPHYDMFRCHDNKGYQELYKKKIGLRGLEGEYYIEFPNSIMRYPSVLKSVSGYGSVGVWKANNKKEYDALRLFFCKKSNYSLIKGWIRSILNLKIDIDKKDYFDSFSKSRIVVQEFISQLTYDYKVLIFDMKYYILKRSIRPHDFRASGSGLWEFPEPQDVDVKLLDFVRDCFNRMDIPFVSFDVCEQMNNYYLIEFQGIHFGPVTMMNSNGYFSYEKTWSFSYKHSILEEEFANSIYNYILRQKKCDE